jgi:hypothetical protein
MNIVVTLYLLLGVLGILFQRSKLLAVIIFFYIWTLAWNTTLPDFGNYQIAYFHETSKDVGYKFVSAQFLNFQVPFFYFMLSFVGAGMCLLAWFVMKFAQRCSLVAALYLWTTARYDIVQYRNFVAFSVILVGIYFLIAYKNKISKIVFSILSFVAASVHVTTIFYWIFVVANKKFLKKVSKVWLVFSVIVVGCLVNYYFADILESKFESYNVGVSILTRSLLIILFISNLFFIRYVNKRKNSARLTTVQTKYMDVHVDFVVLANTFLLILLPAAFLSLNAMRIFRYMAIINFIFISNKFSNRPSGIVGNTIVSVMYAAIYAFICYVMHIEEFQHIIDAISNENLFY